MKRNKIGEFFITIWAIVLGIGKYLGLILLITLPYFEPKLFGLDGESRLFGWIAAVVTVSLYVSAGFIARSIPKNIAYTSELASYYALSSVGYSVLSGVCGFLRVNYRHIVIIDKSALVLLLIAGLTYLMRYVFKNQGEWF